MPPFGAAFLFASGAAGCIKTSSKPHESCIRASSRLFLFCAKISVEVMRVYNNDQPYGYQPHRMGGYGQMQPMYQPYQQPMQNAQPQQEAQMFCRPVASIDEARAVPADFNGKPMIFPHLNAGRIYLKIFDPGSGSAIFREFRLAEPEPEQQTQPAAVFAPLGVVDQIRELDKAVAELKEELKTLKGGKRKPQTQEAMTSDE